MIDEIPVLYYFKYSDSTYHEGFILGKSSIITGRVAEIG